MKKTIKAEIVKEVKAEIIEGLKIEPEKKPAVRMGRFLLSDDDHLKPGWECSLCRAFFRPVSYDEYCPTIWNYCPNCGTKMEK